MQCFGNFWGANAPDAPIPWLRACSRGVTRLYGTQDKNQFGVPMFKPDVFRKQMYCIESTLDIFGTFRRLHSDSAPGELCSPRYSPGMQVFRDRYVKPFALTLTISQISTLFYNFLRSFQWSGFHSCGEREVLSVNVRICLMLWWSIDPNSFSKFLWKSRERLNVLALYFRNKSSTLVV